MISKILLVMIPMTSDIDIVRSLDFLLLIKCIVSLSSNNSSRRADGPDGVRENQEGEGQGDLHVTPGKAGMGHTI